MSDGQRSGRAGVRVLRGGGERGVHRGVYILPNLFTTGSVFLGVYAVLASARGDFTTAAVCIVVAHICDGLDGRIARLTNTESEFGVQYDSLADLVAFGVGPGILMYQWALAPLGAWGWLAACLYVACGALRLARFNVQAPVAEKRSFVGLPIPAAADMIAATVLVCDFFGVLGSDLRHTWTLPVMYSLALLMVSNVRYYSFKDVNLRARAPFFWLVMAIVIAMLAAAQPQLLLFTGMAVYVASGPVMWVYRFFKVRQQRTATVRRMRRRARGGGE